MFETAPWYWAAIRLARVSPGWKSDRRMPGEAADHLRDGDRLADRAPHPEQHRRDDAAPRVREDDAADHLPACQPEPVRALLQLRRHALEELAA